MGDQKRELSCPVAIAKPSRKKKYSSYILARTQPMKSHGFFVYYTRPTSFSFMKGFSFPCRSGTCMWFAMVTDLKLKISADPE